MRPLRHLPLLALAVLAACNRGGGADQPTPNASASAAAAASAAGQPDPRAVTADTARILGRATAPIWVIEVSDYQCPFCKRWHDETFPALRREYVESGRVRFAYVHFPLPNHPHAAVAAEAAMCAGAQGAFWPYHDGVFGAQEQLAAVPDARPLLDSLAGAQRLDAAAFRACLDDRAMRPVVEGDVERMRQAGVQATPTFFIGDVRIQGAQPIEVFREVIDAALAGGRAGGTTGGTAGGAAPPPR